VCAAWREAAAACVEELRIQAVLTAVGQLVLLHAGDVTAAQRRFPLAR
jgi:hypothetical protein